MAGLRIQKRRRRECKTDYKNRLNLLKSNFDRIVIRQSNKYILIQLVTSSESQDKVLSSVSSKDLIKEGLDVKYSGSLKNLTASYLTGLLFASKIDKNKRYIIDVGMSRNIYGNRNSATMKGLLDGGIDLNINEKIFPSKERLMGEHLSEDLKKELEKIVKKMESKK